MARIYIGNLPPDVRKDEVERLFDKYGAIRAFDVKPSRDGRAPAFAFLEYLDARDAEEAVRGRDGYDFGGSRLRVEVSRGGFVSTSSRGPPRRTAFRARVYNLPQSASWQDLKDHMRQAGDVGFSEVVRERGSVVGTVEYGNREDLDRALTKLNGSRFTNRFNDEAEIRVEEDGGSGGYGSERARYPDSYPPPRGRSRSRSRDRYEPPRDDYGYRGGPPPRDDYGYSSRAPPRDDYRGRDDGYRRGGGDYDRRY